jgi:hypothetical protein
VEDSDKHSSLFNAELFAAEKGFVALTFEAKKICRKNELEMIFHSKTQKPISSTARGYKTLFVEF